MPGRTVTEVLQRPVTEKVPLPEGIGAAAKPGASPTDMPKLRKGVPTGMGYGHPAEILRRRLPDRVVNGVPQSAPFRRIAGRGMRVLRSTPDGKTEGKNLLQPVLLSFGDGPEACGGNLRMVRGEVYRRQRTRAAVLQPELCHSGPVPPSSTAWKPAHPFG